MTAIMVPQTETGGPKAANQLSHKGHHVQGLETWEELVETVLKLKGRSPPTITSITYALCLAKAALNDADLVKSGELRLVVWSFPTSLVDKAGKCDAGRTAACAHNGSV